MNNPALRWAAALLLYGYYQLVLGSSRLRIRVDPATEALVRQGVPVIYVLWHRHVFCIPLLRRQARRSVAVLSSGHRDSRITAVGLRLCHLDVVVGSSTRGGMGAYRKLLRLLRGGQSVCITPDGPKGPPGQAKAGVIQLARHSGCAVVPVAVATTRQRQLRSWDRTLVPLPFGRVVLALGAPIHGDGSVSFDAHRQQVSEALDRLGASLAEGAS